ncbi:FkbM family methyltransferase [Synechococcus sp. CBW1006]|uniref:FkbM family methyltransferase n=1 Tax=Synechococcus sp. CBW1006 TaxID=1353138 RepID=UPI0018CF4DCE|nr:FkbM family methyltransferase [Synechococcus sp. CBW1006]QPN65927.1 FkbM family methyltransferase [Synechococcus sp. CBW1006]
MTFNPRYAWLAARLRLPHLPSPMASFGGVTFSVEPEHYQLRGVLKQLAIQPVLARLLALCDQETLFVDIGANIGLFSLLIASQTGAKVLAFEPVRSTFQALVRNCSHNRHLNVAPLNLALGSASTAVEITALPGSGINQVVSARERQGVPRQWAPQLLLDQLLIEYLINLNHKTVIKIDVERYEFEVLEGARQILSANLPIALCVEIDPGDRKRLEDRLRPVF